MGNQRYSMRWVWIDDGSGVQQTMSAVANVVRRHNVDFVWGGYASGLCKFTARQAYQEDKLCLCGAAASPTAFSENNLTYGALPPDVHYIINSLRAIKSGAQSADTQGAATQPSDPLQPGFCGDAGCEASLKVGVLYADPLVGMCANVYTEASDLGYSVAPGFSYAAGAMPKEPSAEQVDAVLTQMIDNEINVVIGCTYHSTCKAVSEGLERLNFSPLAIAFTSCVDSPYFAADVHSGWYPGEYIMGVSPYHFSNPTRGTFSGLTSSEFLQRYVDRYKSTPSYHGPSHFALACALAKAIEDAGAVDTQSVKAALDQLSLQEFAFANPIEFTEELYGQNDPVMLVIQYARETSGDPSAAEVIVFPENAVTVGQMHFPNPPWEMRRCRALGAGSTLQDRQDPVTLALKMRRVRDNGGECSGHGLCVADGTCACDDDWQGENCEESSLITECPVNTYAIQFDPLVCRVCPDGSVSEPGSVSEHDCTPRMEVEWQDCEPCKTFGPTEGEDACERCPKGYELGVNGSKYVDFDECTVNNGDCDPLAVPICTNLVGSYQCGSCPSGFVGDGDVGCELPAVHHDEELDIMFAAVIPTATLAATADSAILDNPTNYMNSIQGLLADALNVSTTAVTISNVRQADSGGDNGRRLQQSVSVLFDVGVAGPDASTAMRMLYSKLQDSQFCEATSITEGQQIAVVPSCPPGLYRPESQILCTECPWNHYLQDGGCVECPFLTTVNRDPLTVDEMPCVCQAGMFDISSTAVRGAFCFELDFFEDPFSETSVFNHYRTDKDKGLLCSYCPECMDCNAHPGMITVIPGWKTVDTGPDAMTATTQNISVMSRLGLTAEVSALICPYPDSCLGDTVVNGTVISKCASGFTGHLCAACAEGYTFTKVGCEECTTQGLLVLPLVCVGILILSLFYAEFEQWFAENGQHYQNLFFEGKRLVVPISKILVTTAQIIGSLPITMDFIFPDSMTAFIDFLRVFAVDVFLILRTNCLLGNSFYVKFATTFLIPVIVAVFLFAYSAWKARQHKMPEVGGLSLKQRKHLLDEYESLAARGGPEDNQVTASDIAGCCEDLDVDMSHEEIDTIMRNADKDADGHISFEEFVHILHEGSGKFPELIGAFEMRRHMQSVNAMVSVIVFLLYPGVCQTAFSALRCRDLAPGLSVLLQDYTIDCNSEEYQIFRIVAIVAILLGPVGIPVGARTIIDHPKFHLLSLLRCRLSCKSKCLSAEF